MYIDLFIIQNLIYDYLILSGVAILIDERFCYPRLILGLLISFVLSAFAFVNFPIILIFIPFITLKVVFWDKTPKIYLKTAFYFFGIGMFLNGVMNTLTYFVSFRMTMIPYVLITLGIAFFVTLVHVMKTSWISKQEIITQFTHEVRIFCGRTEIKGWGFVDTGNHLVDDRTSNPVIMIPKGKLAANSVDEFLNQQRVSFWEVNYSVINDESQSLLVFKPTLLMINETIVQNVVVGVVDNSFVEYDFLLQPSVVRNI